MENELQYYINVKKYRLRKNLTQKQLATYVGISHNYLSEIENDKKLPTLEILLKIANALDICPRQLIYCTIIECK